MKILKTERAKKNFTLFTSWLKISVLAFFTVLIIRGFILIPITIDGNSMSSTLKAGDAMVMEKFTPIHRFDIVVIKTKNGEVLVKRIIGLPNETLSFTNGNLYIDGKLTKEDFLNTNLKNYHSKTNYTNDFSLTSLTGKKRLGNNEYFVLGDNRPYSRDSRLFGAITNKQIIGKGLFVYYPFTHIHSIN
jgi:signal peptidase I